LHLYNTHKIQSRTEQSAISLRLTGLSVIFRPYGRKNTSRNSYLCATNSGQLCQIYHKWDSADRK